MFPHIPQYESHSISENSIWGIRRKFEQGKVVVNHKKFLSYDKDEEGNLIIDEKQAKIVRRIYKDYLDGKGSNRIARELEMERRQAFAETYGVFKLYYATLDNLFAGRVICRSCGSIFGRNTWHSTNEKLKRKVWMCSNRYKVKGEKGCSNKHIDDKVLYQTFINTFNAIIENKDYFIEKWKDGLKSEDVLVRNRSKQFIKIIEKAEQINEFDVNLFLRLIEKMTVFEGKQIIITLLEGIEIE